MTQGSGRPRFSVYIVDATDTSHRPKMEGLRDVLTSKDCDVTEISCHKEAATVGSAPNGFIWTSPATASALPHVETIARESSLDSSANFHLPMEAEAPAIDRTRKLINGVLQSTALHELDTNKLEDESGRLDLAEQILEELEKTRRELAEAREGWANRARRFRGEILSVAGASLIVGIVGLHYARKSTIEKPIPPEVIIAENTPELRLRVAYQPDIDLPSTFNAASRSPRQSDRIELRVGFDQPDWHSYLLQIESYGDAKILSRSDSQMSSEDGTFPFRDDEGTWTLTSYGVNTIILLASERYLPEAEREQICIDINKIVRATTPVMTATEHGIWHGRGFVHEFIDTDNEVQTKALGTSTPAKAPAAAAEYGDFDAFASALLERLRGIDPMLAFDGRSFPTGMRDPRSTSYATPEVEVSSGLAIAVFDPRFDWQRVTLRVDDWPSRLRNDLRMYLARPQAEWSALMDSITLLEVAVDERPEDASIRRAYGLVLERIDDLSRDFPEPAHYRKARDQIVVANELGSTAGLRDDLRRLDAKIERLPKATADVDRSESE